MTEQPQLPLNRGQHLKSLLTRQGQSKKTFTPLCKDFGPSWQEPPLPGFPASPAIQLAIDAVHLPCNFRQPASQRRIETYARTTNWLLLVQAQPMTKSLFTNVTRIDSYPISTSLLDTKRASHAEKETNRLTCPCPGHTHYKNQYLQEPHPTQPPINCPTGAGHTSPVQSTTTAPHTAYSPPNPHHPSARSPTTTSPGVHLTPHPLNKPAPSPHKNTPQ